MLPTLWQVYSEFAKGDNPPRLSDMSFHWYVLHVKPHKERPVFELLEAKQITTYYPAIAVEPVNPRARKERPFFPGYLFVHLDLDDIGSNALRWTEGTHGLVEFGGVPATVPENLINEIKQRLLKWQVKSEGGVDNLKRGDRVRISGGLFEGYEAIFDSQLPGKQRVQVLLAYLKEQPKRLQIDTEYIQKIRKDIG